MTPLISAIIENDFEGGKLHLQDKEPDPLGFSPFEIACLLNRSSFIAFLRPHMHLSHLTQKKDALSFVRVFAPEWISAFQVEHCPTIKFPSYQAIKEAVSQCPYLLRSPYLAKENHELGKEKREAFFSGYFAETSIKWIDDHMGYGLFTGQYLQQMEYVGEYAGLVGPITSDSVSDYCMHYPTKWKSRRLFAIDAYWCGNAARFINHSTRPNLQIIPLVDRSLLHIGLFASQKIGKQEQLTIDYGDDFWLSRKI